jgi:Golgi SNAP receptor complex protein 2
VLVRVDQLKYDLQHLKAALESQLNRAAVRQREARDREALLHTKFTTNARDSETTILINR